MACRSQRCPTLRCDTGLDASQRREVPIILDVSIILVLTASDFLTIVSFLNAVYGCAQLLEKGNRSCSCPTCLDASGVGFWAPELCFLFSGLDPSPQESWQSKSVWPIWRGSFWLKISCRIRSGEVPGLAM